METFNIEFLSYVFLDNKVSRWLTAVAIFLALVVLLNIIKKVGIRRFEKFSERTSTRIDDLVTYALKNTKQFFILATSLIVATSSLKLPGDAGLILKRALILVVLLQVIFWGNAIITFFFERRVSQGGVTAPVQSAAHSLIKLGLYFILYSLVLLTALDSMGINITALVAGLGVGGIAIALAVQSLLSDLFASLSIALDKPFVIGDFLDTGDHVGTVEKVGLKTTRIRSVTGEELIYPNANLLQSRLRNYKSFPRRRNLFTIGVTYDTPYEKLKAIPSLIKKAIGEKDNVTFDRSHLVKYGASSIDFETVYWVMNVDYNLFLDIQQEVMLNIYKIFSEQNIEFAFPTQTLYVKKAELSEEAQQSRAELPV